MKPKYLKGLTILLAFAMCFYVFSISNSTTLFADTDDTYEIADQFVAFDGTDESNATSFADRLETNKKDTYGGAGGSAVLDNDGALVLSNTATYGYASTQFFFGATNLGNYAIMIEAEVIAGELYIATRLTADDFSTYKGFDSKGYAALITDQPSGGVMMKLVRREGTFDAYSGEQSSASKKVTLMITVDGYHVSLIGADGNTISQNKYGDVFDNACAGVTGDIALVAGNKTDGNAANIKITKFAFYNIENVDDEKLVWPNPDFVEVVDTGSLTLLKQYDGAATYGIDETITLDLEDYFATTVVTFDDISFLSAGQLGTFSGNSWSFTFTEVKEYDFDIIASVPTVAKIPMVFLTFSIQVVSPPTLTFAPTAFKDFDEGDSENTYLIGYNYTITLPMPTVNGYGESAPLTCTVVSPTSQAVTLTNNSFKAQELGEYTVTYSAQSVHGTTSIAITLISEMRPGSEDPVFFSVTIFNGQQQIKVVVVPKDSLISEEDAPDIEGLSFKGWYLDADYTQEFNTATAITSDMELYGKWEAETNNNDNDKDDNKNKKGCNSSTEAITIAFSLMTMLSFAGIKKFAV